MVLTPVIEQRASPKAKKPYRKPQVRSQKILLPSLFACTPPKIECPSDPSGCALPGDCL